MIGLMVVSVVLLPRFKRLRTPANVFIINLTISDFCACLLHPMTVYSALIDSRWSFGQFGMPPLHSGICFNGNHLIRWIQLLLLAIRLQSVRNGSGILRPQYDRHAGGHRLRALRGHHGQAGRSQMAHYPTTGPKGMSHIPSSFSNR